MGLEEIGLRKMSLPLHRTISVLNPNTAGPPGIPKRHQPDDDWQ